MAYDEYLGDRITQILKTKNVAFFAKKMMGGLIFMVREKMCVGIHIDKKYGDSLLMAKIGQDAYAKEIEKEECLPMDFTGRPMKGYIFITPEGFDTDEQMEYWIELAVQFNATL
jgi:hypothetical protein